jgi:hypothetical protein
MVAGPLRERAERTLAGLRRQTALERIEVIVVDGAGLDSRQLRVPEGLPAKRLELAEPEPGEDRSAGIGAARSPVIAFIEDHSVPDPGWAESLIEAHCSRSPATRRRSCSTTTSCTASSAGPGSRCCSSLGP